MYYDGNVFGVVLGEVYVLCSFEPSGTLREGDEKSTDDLSADPGAIRLIGLGLGGGKYGTSGAFGEEGIAMN